MELIIYGDASLNVTPKSYHKTYIFSELLKAYLVTIGQKLVEQSNIF